jgi:hypothetical protein
VDRPVICGDDGAFCNGDESCDEAGDSCVSSGDLNSRAVAELAAAALFR